MTHVLEGHIWRLGYKITTGRYMVLQGTDMILSDE